jgi:hypothetical protein
LPTAIDVSSVVGLVAIGALTGNILLGLLISSGYNPLRRWPRRRIKLFTLHNWTGYTARRSRMAASSGAAVDGGHSTSGFRVFHHAGSFGIQRPTRRVYSSYEAPKVWRSVGSSYAMTNRLTPANQIAQ